MQGNLSKFKKGFTLVELIIVIGVLALLAVSAIMIVSNVRENARTATAKSNAQTIVRSVNMYNSLVSDASSKITSDGNLSTTKLSTLGLTAVETGGQPMNLGVNISDAELTEAKRWLGVTGTAGLEVWAVLESPTT